MKKILISLAFSLLISNVAPIAAVSSDQIKNIAALKRTLRSHLNEFIKCIKGDADCDPQKKKVIKTTLAILAIIGVTAAGAGVLYFVKRKGILPKLNPPLSDIRAYKLEVSKVKKPTATNDLLIALLHNNIYNIVSAIRAGADLDALVTVFDPAFNKKSFIFYASSGEAVKYLLANNPNLLEVTEGPLTKSTPLIAMLSQASQLGDLGGPYLQAAKVLIEQGANVNAINNLNETPLILAARANAPETFLKLVEKGANPITLKSISEPFYESLKTFSNDFPVAFPTVRTWWNWKQQKQ